VRSGNSPALAEKIILPVERGRLGCVTQIRVRATCQRMGLHDDLNQAAKIATREMLNFVVENKGLSRDDAFMLLSAAMDLQVTQIVDGTKGVHALLPKSIFRN
jgi:acetamidase/formamidase